MKKEILSILFSCSLMVISCGQKESKKDEHVSAPAYEEEQVNLEPVNDSITSVVLLSDDNMRYDQSEIKVQAGKLVKLTLKHIGKMPKTAMGHNFVLLKKGIDPADFGAEVAQGQGPEYKLSKEASLKTIASTKMIGGGESVTIEFMAPEKGQYNYLCSFPGHYSQMKGVLIVE
ncbi:MAG: azurin [Flavobacterium sp.]|uniref:plastocyanin/azurin family copper-binding protein n=1 Tax=Flavobacterium sp. TaxID=239 RepID=UPI001B218B60|nr:plastocyanin/azurin family copper-binding protein [Flavobacterium sp.]MBO9584476.1 azurin [Flavobacterium sp.]